MTPTSTPLSIHHLALRTHAFEAVGSFYRDVVGLPLVEEARSGSIWLSLGDSSLLMVEEADASEPRVEPASLALMAFHVPAAEMAQRIAALTDAGVTIEARTAYTVYFRDPEGRRLGFSAYPDAIGDLADA